MIHQLIEQWLEKYVDCGQIIDVWRSRGAEAEYIAEHALYDALLFELADCGIYDRGMLVMEHSPVSALGIREALCVALATWQEKRACHDFIDQCMRRLGAINPQNTPALLTHIITGGAYPYLLPALKLGFVRDAVDGSFSRRVYYGPDLAEEESWCAFVDEVEARMGEFDGRYYPGIELSDEGMMLRGRVRRRFLRARRRVTKWSDRAPRVSEWWLMFDYFAAHSGVMRNDEE